MSDNTALQVLPKNEVEVARDQESWWAWSNKMVEQFLNDGGGIVSTRKLRQLLQADPQFQTYKDLSIDDVLEKLKENDTDGLKWRYEGRSFYTLEAYTALIKKLEEDSVDHGPILDELTQVREDQGILNEVSGSALDEVGLNVAKLDIAGSLDRRTKRSNAQEESKMCSRYLLPFFKDMYDGDYIPIVTRGREEVELPNVFDVHNERPSSDMRNVDLIAVDWRDRENVELVTVEAKLEFNTAVVQQAANYTRFSDRVWIAIRCDSSHTSKTAAEKLISKNRLLFDYVLHLGIGVVVCRAAVGGSYQPFVLQWPKLQEPNKFEKKEFLNSYNPFFVEAGVLPATGTRRVSMF